MVLLYMHGIKGEDMNGSFWPNAVEAKERATRKQKGRRCEIIKEPSSPERTNV